MDLPRTCFVKMVHFTCSWNNLVPRNIVTKNHSLKTFFFLKLTVNAGYPKEKRMFLIHCYLKKTPFSMPVHNSEGVQVIQSILCSVATCSQVFGTSWSPKQGIVTLAKGSSPVATGGTWCWLVWSWRSHHGWARENVVFIQGSTKVSFCINFSHPYLQLV